MPCTSTVRFGRVRRLVNRGGAVSLLSQRSRDHDTLSLSTSSSSSASVESLLPSSIMSYTGERLAPSAPTLPRRNSECVEELDRCSLKDNERCHCFWQMLRTAHGISHWINALSCLRRRKHEHRGEDPCVDEGTEMRDVELVGVEVDKR